MSGLKKSRYSSAEMNHGRELVLGTLLLCGALVARHVYRIRCSVSKWRRFARHLGLDNAPAGTYRIAITGVSSGIGKACGDLLREFPSCSVMGMGRSRASGTDIWVDLRSLHGVTRAIDDVYARWYAGNESSLRGRDIIINNAGIFSGHDLADLWRVNLLSPCFLTESLASKFDAHGAENRSLRFVQVTSRLEKQSALESDNIQEILTGGLRGSNHQSSMRNYADSKRALILHTAYMSGVFSDDKKKLTFVAVTPGMVNTNLGTQSVSSLVWWITAPLRFLLLRHPIEGAVAVLSAAFSDMSHTGVYFGDDGETMESIVETRGTRLGKCVSDIVRNEFINSLSETYRPCP